MISVIMLTYNRETIVPRAIESILGQTYRDFEFIIVDNGSTDGSGRIADTYAARDGRIRVIHREKGNIGAGRNTGLDAAQGEYLTFIDDDDWADPDFLEFLLGLLEENAADVAICGSRKWENGEFIQVGIEKKALLTQKDSLVELLWRKRYNNGFPTKLIRRCLFDGLRFPEEKRYEDIYLMYRVLAKAQRVVSYGVPKYNVYRHEKNNSAPTEKDNVITNQYITDYCGAYRERTEWLCRHFPAQSDYWRYFEWSFMLSMVKKITENNLTNCSNQFRELKKELLAHYLEFSESPYILDFERSWLKKYVADCK